MASVLINQPHTELGEVLSPSQLSTWLDCAARWMFRYIEGRPDPSTPTQALGRAVHAAVGEAMQYRINTGETLDAEKALSAFCAAWAREAEGVEGFEVEAALKLGAEGVGLTEIYLDQAGLEPAAAEINVDGEIGGVRVRGIVDILDIEGRVIDVKTSSRAPSSMGGRARLQAATYSTLAPGANGKMRVDTLVRGRNPRLVRHEAMMTDADRRALDRLYPLAQAGMRSGVYAPNRESKLCSRHNCPYWRACEAEYGGEVRS